jgi:hypothetical protein
MLVKNQFRAIKRIIPIFEVTAVSTDNQPANDDVQVISDNAGDTQLITLFGVDNSDKFQYHTVTLNGVTAVDSVLNPKWKTIYGAFLGDKYGNISARATGTITIREKSVGAAITTIAATKLSTGEQFFYCPGEDIIIENIAGNTWFNALGGASTTGASGQVTGRMSIETAVPTAKEYISLISDGTGSTVQIYVMEV